MERGERVWDRVWTLFQVHFGAIGFKQKNYLIYILRGSLPEVVSKKRNGQGQKQHVYIFFDFRKPECDGWGDEGGELEAGYVFGGTRNLWGSMGLIPSGQLQMWSGEKDWSDMGARRIAGA